MPKCELMRSHLNLEGKIEKPCLERILREVTAVFRKSEQSNSNTSAALDNEPNMLRVEEPVIIIGDIHGQYFDMIHMFEKIIDKKGLP